MRARQPQASGYDVVLRMRTDWGLGFALPGGPMWPDLGVPGIFGHTGASGSLAFAEPEHRLAFGYTPNLWAELSGSFRRRGSGSAPSPRPSTSPQVCAGGPTSDDTGDPLGQARVAAAHSRETSLQLPISGRFRQFSTISGEVSRVAVDGPAVDPSGDADHPLATWQCCRRHRTARRLAWRS